jgi:hypothetical protein
VVRDLAMRTPNATARPPGRENRRLVRRG